MSTDPADPELLKAAETTFLQLPVESREAVARWWKTYFWTLGHKRLAKILLSAAEPRKGPTTDVGPT